MSRAIVGLLIMAVFATRTSSLSFPRQQNPHEFGGEQNFLDQFDPMRIITQVRALINEGLGELHSPELNSIDMEWQQKKDQESLSWFKGKSVLFLGDSTAEEIFWELLFSLNQSAPERATRVPSNECGQDSCVNICNDGGFHDGDDLWQHYLVRCADGAKQKCRDSLPVARDMYDLKFQFFWTGNPYVCDNGWGLHYDLADAKWMEAFNAMVAKGPYDIVVFTAGNHDFVRPTPETNSSFREALNTVLSDTFAIAPTKIFLLSAAPESRAIANEVLQMQQNQDWKVIDRREYHSTMHCTFKDVNTTYVGYHRTDACHQVVEAITDVVNGLS